MILIDATPLVALCDARDAKHQLAMEQFDVVATERLAVCDAVLTEANFHLPHESQRLRLRAFLEELEVLPLPAIPDRGFWLDVFDWLLKYADHEPDFADACLAVLSERNPDVKVWTYDREFRTTWRRPNGTAIPLAVR